MPRKLSPSEAKANFEDLTVALPKQHLRLQFRKRFGTGELLDADMFKKGTAAAPRDRPVTNLLQEVPEKLDCVRLIGTAEELRGDEWSATTDVRVGDLFSPEEVEQVVIVQGRKARLYVYADPTADVVYAYRVVTPLAEEERPAPRPLSRSRRAASGRPSSGRSGPNRRGRR